MKRVTCLLLVLMALSCPLLAQDRDSLLRRINQIKLDTDRYLYGLSTMPGEAKPEKSIEAAAKELKVQLEAFLNTDAFVFLKEKKEIPADYVETVSCLLRPNTYRSIVFVEKARLLELEQSLGVQLTSDTRIDQLSSLINGILEAGKIDEVLDLIVASPLVEEIRASQKIDDESQPYANDAILVYFDPKTKKVVEVMTPLDENLVRKNARTGQEAEPIRYRNAPLWVYIEGLKNSNVL